MSEQELKNDLESAQNKGSGEWVKMDNSKPPSLLKKKGGGMGECR
jgi:hypothetical protein